MQELEKILEEIESMEYPAEGIGCGLEDISITDRYESAEYGWNEAVERITEIIRNHMNDGWIPVEERLPEVCRKIKEDSECPEYNVTIPGAEKATTLKYSPADETWFDDLGYVYPVIAWQPLPEIHHPERRDKHDRE